MAADMLCCASCGKAEVDDVNLKKCACDLVKYCSVECQKNHRPQHKRACKKRMAEIRDDRLFQQPEGMFLGECPICCIPLPLDDDKSSINSCCCKHICKGCSYANTLREREQGLEERCPYCREPVPKSQEEANQNIMKRVKVNDPVAMFKMGVKCEEEGDFEGAIQYWIKAAELGDIEAHYNLSCYYREGRQGVERDEKKKMHHMEEAAIGGHPTARYNLGSHEWSNRRYDRAMRHFIISAKQGFDDALDAVKHGFQTKDVNKEDFEAALRGHQAAVDETKSEQRAAAYEFFNSARLWAGLGLR